MKHLWPYFVRIFVHSFALYVGGGDHSRVSHTSGTGEECIFQGAFVHLPEMLVPNHCLFQRCLSSWCQSLSAPQRCNAERSDAQRNFFTSLFIPHFLQRHRCDALPSFAVSPCKLVDIARIAFPPLLPFFLSPQWFTVQNNKKFTKSHNAAMSSLASQDGHRKRKRSDAVH